MNCCELFESREPGELSNSFESLESREPRKVVQSVWRESCVSSREPCDLCESCESCGLCERCERHLPKTVRAGTDSLLIQKDTCERMTVMMQGMYVWIMK